MAEFCVGDQVEKYTGDYQLLGEVRAVLTTKSGKTRYVVEHEPGFLHIYSEANLCRSPAAGEGGEESAAKEIHEYIKQLVKPWTDFRGHEIDILNIIRKHHPSSGRVR